MSATATLFYGYHLGELIADREDAWKPEQYVYTVAPAWMRDGGEPDGEISDDWDVDEQVARRLGWAEVPYPKHLEEQFPDPPRGYSVRASDWLRDRDAQDARRRSHPDYLAWSASRDEMRLLVKEADIGIKLGYYGAESETGLYLAVRESITSTDYGCEPIPRLQEPGAVLARWGGKLARFLELTELEPPRPVGWHVASYYG